MTIRLPRLTAALLVGGLTIGAATPAFGQEESGETEGDTEHVVNLRSRCQQAIERRLGDLNRAQARIDGVDVLTAAHENSLDAIIDSTESGLSQLSASIADEDNRLELVQLCSQIAAEYRVYLVVLPQTHLTVGADRVDAAAARGDELISTFDETVEAAIAAGANVDAAVALRNQAVAHLDIAESSNSGVAAGALSVTPAGYNDGSGEVILDTVRGDLRTAHAELKSGLKDGKAAVHALRAAIGDLEDAA